MDQIRLDGRKTLEAVYRDHRGEFIQWARNQFRCADDEALEAFQQAVVTLYENVVHGKLTELTSSLKTYLFAIGKYKIMELRRYQQKQESTDGIDLPEDEDVTVGEDLLRLARESISRISEPCRSLLVDFYYHGRTMQQLAASHDYKNEDTVKSQKYRCLQSLRKIFRETRVKRGL